MSVVFAAAAGPFLLSSDDDLCCCSSYSLPTVGFVSVPVESWCPWRRPKWRNRLCGWSSLNDERAAHPISSLAHLYRTHLVTGHDVIIKTRCRYYDNNAGDLHVTRRMMDSSASLIHIVALEKKIFYAMICIKCGEYLTRSTDGTWPVCSPFHPTTERSSPGSRSFFSLVRIFRPLRCCGAAAVPWYMYVLCSIAI